MPAQKNFFKTLALISAILFFAGFTGSVNAQTLSSTTAIPPKVELKGDPGQTLTATLKVRNDSPQTNIYSITVEDFVVVDNQGTPIPVTANAGNRWSLGNWVTAPKMIPVDAGGLQIIDITIKIPLTALPGGHYAMITYTPNADTKPGDLKQTGNIITQRVGTLLYVTVSGPVTEKAGITRFTAPRFTEMGPVDFTGTIESLSTIHINPKGTITISNPINSKVAEVVVDAGNIFPETSRDFTATWNQKWGWGRYKADLSLTYGTIGTLVATTYFWFFPIRLVIYVLVALIAVLAIIIILNNRSKKHQEELEKEVRALKEELQNVENTEK